MEQFSSFCISVLLVLGLTNSCSLSSTKAVNNKIGQPKTVAKVNVSDTLRATDLFTLSDAEKIMGEPGRLVNSETVAAGMGRESSPKDSVFHIKKTASFYGCAYEANKKDEKTGRPGKIYFLVEEYPNVVSASTVYSYYKRSNEHHDGFKELKLADEAWFGNSPLFVYVRKANKLMIMKVNGMTSKTSSDGFNEVVKKIALAF
jgi:hypothetical protein